MTLTIHSEENDQRELAVTVEVAEERVREAMRKTARKLSREMRVPGFRPGKAPYHMIVRYFGEASVRGEAVEELAQSVFEEMLDQLDVEPYAPASLDNMELEPLVLTFTIPLMPTVKLGDYRSLRDDVPTVEVTEEAIQQALEQMRENQQILEPVERPAERGDVVTLTVLGQLTSSDPVRTIINEERTDFILDDDRIFFGEPFVREIVGLSTGDEKEFELTFPDDFEDEELAGQMAEFRVTILDVRRRELPEIDDELAREVGQFETLEELKQSVAEQLEKDARTEAETALIDQMITNIMPNAELAYPPAAVEAELDNFIERAKGRVTRGGWEWEDYLKLRGETEEDIREQNRAGVEESLRSRLVVTQLMIEEKLGISQDDIEAMADEEVKNLEGELQASLREFYTGQYGAQLLGDRILRRKLAERISAILTGNAPDLATLDEVDDEEE